MCFKTASGNAKICGARGQVRDIEQQDMCTAEVELLYLKNISI